MGWLWGSGSPPSTAAAAPARPAPEPAPAVAAAPPPPLSREEQADAELQSLLDSLNGDAQPAKPKFQHTPRARAPDGQSPPVCVDTDEPLEEQLLPRDMSCRQAFDSAFYCQSMGGQFNNLYRYGNMKDCSQHWSDFWFCMKLRSYTGEEREDMVKDHYRKKEMKYKTGPSSEDVWKSRDKKLEWGEALCIPLDESQN